MPESQLDEKHADSLRDLDLPWLAMEEAGFSEDPLPHFEAARRRHPWLAKCAFGYVVHEYAAAQDMLRMDEAMRTANDAIVALMGAENTPWGRFQHEMIGAHTGASHKRLRDAVASKFTPKKANQARPLMREVIGGLLDEWAPKGRFDFEEFASYFPITVMSRLIGADPAVIPSLRSSLEAFGLSFSLDRNHLPALQEAMGVLDRFVHELVEERRQQVRPGGPADLLDDLTSLDGEQGLSDRELADLLIFLFVAGYDTSKNVLTLIMHALLDRPSDYARCAADPAFAAKVVEEALRYHNPATIPRLTTQDLTYRGVAIPQGTMLFFPVSVLGRDPGAVADPDRFDPERDQKNRHLAFGRGMHMCLGQFIARAQIEEGLHLIARRITRPHRVGPSGWRPFFGVWGLRGLPIEFTPGPGDQREESPT